MLFFMWNTINRKITAFFVIFLPIQNLAMVQNMKNSFQKSLISEIVPQRLLTNRDKNLLLRIKLIVGHGSPHFDAKLRNYQNVLLKISRWNRTFCQCVRIELFFIKKTLPAFSVHRLLFVKCSQNLTLKTLPCQT